MQWKVSVTAVGYTVADVMSIDDLKRQPVLPADVMENINSMQSTVEQLLADMSLVSNYAAHVI